ncbi:MAG: DUF1549 and DUF1553 domain-containing protein [Verrucomicrobiales bacterium]
MRAAALTLILGAAAGGFVAAAADDGPIPEEARGHWAFQKPVRAALPDAATAESAHPIDRFIGARLAAAGLGFAPEADRHALIRRLRFDLTGLPPHPDEIARFLADDEPDAAGRLADRLLAAPGFGERQAQHWLDVARFAETDGFEHDKVRPEAWRYRDWLVGAFNADLPYDRFAQLQLAADEIAPGDEAALAATGFLVCGPDMPDINDQDERRHEFLNGMAATVGDAFLALTLGCCQCHDHKTDPVSIGDFYRMRAIFANTVPAMKRDKPVGHAVRERGIEAPPSYIRERGDFRAEGAPAEPAFLRVLNPGGEAIPPPAAGAASTGRRAAFARWLTRPDHPLTARVIANRVWQSHFGTGIVRSSEDFGATGEPPSHPALLDWLATELPAQGWSLKRLHRAIVLSRTYRQSSRGDGDAWRAALDRDPANEWLSRMPRRRLEGEAIRDAFLAAAGQLDRAAGGASVRPPLPPEVTATLLRGQWDVTETASAAHRRSLYVFVRRNLRYPIFEVFDRPDPNQSCSRRDRSTTAPQSLMLLNSDFSIQIAEAIAARVESEASGEESRIARAYALLFAREPTAAESAVGREFLQGGSLADYCLGLLNSNEAVYID